MNFEAQIFASQIHELGRDKFADWLIKSFAGSESVPVPGWFHFDQDDFFVFEFSHRAQSFGEETLQIARPAIQMAIEKFDLEKGSWEGLYALVGIAEAVGFYDFVPVITQTLNLWLPTEQDEPLTKLPETAADILFLRESLESALRIFLNPQKHSSIYSLHFSEIRAWSSNLFRNHPHERKLVPAWAPAFVFAYAEAEGQAERENLIDQLWDGRQKYTDPFPEFNEYKEGNRAFPYALSRICSNVESWLEYAGMLSLGQSRSVSVISIPPTDYASVPLSGETGSATVADSTSDVDPTAYLSTLNTF